MRVKCLAQEHNTMSPARARTQTARSEDERTNHKTTAPPTKAPDKSSIHQPCSFKMAGYWPCSFLCLWTETEKRSLPISSHLDLTLICIINTFRAAIFEVPTTFPSLSFTSIPVNSSWFLIRTTLQIFAVARGREEKIVSLSLFDNWVMFDKNGLRCDFCMARFFCFFPAILLIINA